MRRRLAAALIPIAVLAMISFLVIVVNQSFQLVALAERLHPMAGDVVFWLIVAVFAFGIGVPIYILMTLPKPLAPPEDADGPDYEEHIKRLRTRLARNPYVGSPPETVEDIHAALTHLDTTADERTKAAASQVFLTTAISQNGSLDALLVLAAQSRLILQIARVYYQRPTVRDLTYLYSNVAATAFVAAELDDIDVSEQIQPVLTAVLGSSVAAIPGMSAAAGLFVNSVTTGASNAYLTLRVGIITRQYCRSLVRPERRTIRHAAAVQAARMLGGIAREGAATVAAALWAKPRRYFTELIESASSSVDVMRGAVIDRSQKAWSALTGRGVSPAGEQPEPEP